MNIVRFTNGDPLDQNTLNAPLTQIENAINTLESSVQNMEHPSYVVIYDAVCNTDVIVGDAVYFDNGVINKALAVYSTSFDNEGELLANESAYPIGVVINKNVDGAADVLISGKFTPSASFISNALGSNPQFGEYYLSGENAGKISQERASMPVRILTYNVDNTITVNISNPPTNYHKHTYCKLENGWSIITSSNRATVTAGVPTGFVATYYYDIDADPVASNIFSNYGSAFIYVYGGAINVNGFYYNGKYLLANFAPEEEVLVFANLPCVTDQPILRALRANSNRVKLTEDHGIVTIDVDKYTENSVITPSTTAITDISESGVITRTSVVSEVVTDSTITKVPGNNGRVLLSLHGSSRKVCPEIVSLNLATSTVINDRIVYVLPQGVTSSMLGRITVPDIAEGFTYTATPYIEPIGLNGAFQLDVTLNMEYIKQGSETGITDFVGGKTINQSITETVNNNTCYLFTSPSSSIIMNTPGELFLKVSATTPSNDNIIIGFGVFLKINPAE